MRRGVRGNPARVVCGNKDNGVAARAEVPEPAQVVRIGWIADEDPIAVAATAEARQRCAREKDWCPGRRELRRDLVIDPYLSRPEALLVRPGEPISEWAPPVVSEHDGEQRREGVVGRRS